MRSTLLIFQIILSVAMIGLILPQARGQGFIRSTNTSFTRRGLEKVIFKATFVVALLFLIVSILQIVL